MKNQNSLTLWDRVYAPLCRHREQVLAQSVGRRWAQFLVLWTISLLVSDTLLVCLVSR